MLRFDFSFMFEPNVKGGVTEEEFSQLQPTLTRFVEEIAREKPAFVKVLFDRNLMDAVEDLREWILNFDTLVVIGIGGSSLGAAALANALKPFDWNYLSKSERGGYLRIFFLENVDPDYTASVFDRIDPRYTIFNVVSKSGSTAECLAHYQIVRGLLEVRGLNPAEHIVFTTDPKKGLLRRIAEREKIVALDIPPELGGRFSVLSPVGLLPAMAIGVDIKALIDGAKDAYAKCVVLDMWKNPAAMMAACHYLHKLKGRRISVMMPYTNRLYTLADWFRQLWAESLGKKYSLEKEVVHEGLTPIKALGVVDQHSQVQLYNEGPDDKTITFVEVENFDRDILIPSIHDDEEISYLGGKKLSNLLRNELFGTERSLAFNNRPSMRVIFPSIDAYELGQFFMYYEFTTALMGKLLKINPYDQPGVELGKQITYSLMGRKGFEKMAFPELSKKVVIE
ncbi:MAG: glucose-6-phosphate isomerase [Pseudothermotoga sp.]|uniref:glucose-6-phosphate isomerase n=1 Tax=Pseudothermotoga sp. TaxID=2033661 RepID=UPI000A469E1F|nr:glucose-6-phosphate isomerase [Pseudothermotoga sp.]HBT39362.1 glucose-6-phosphate isomerase [Pseudothermotoga sp.]HCO98969.1 glucose-6-phosphate isomerase [Pseudothermotoga sp.]